jgi:hypothetical protein
MHHYCGIPESPWQWYELGHFIQNCVEDYKVEFIGTAEYPGMSRERAFSRAIYFKLASTPSDVVEEFAQLLLLGAVKDKRPDPRVVKAVHYVKSSFLTVASEKIAEEVCRILGVNPRHQYFYPSRSPMNYPVALTRRLKKDQLKKAVEDYLRAQREAERELLRQATQAESETQTGSESEKGSETESQRDLDEEVEEILRAPEDVKEEIEEMRRANEKLEAGRKGASAEVLHGVFLPSLLDQDESPYYDEELINHLIAQLRRVQRGWKEVHSHTGELDVDSYVSRQSKVFVDEERIKVGGYRVLILLDHSGSIEPFEDVYKTACVALAESLSVLKIPFAVYAFSENPQTAGTITWLIKSFDEPWTRLCAKRLAQIRASGGTPLDRVYRNLSSVVQRRSQGRLLFVTLTDGAPDSIFQTKLEVKHLKEHCRMIAIAIGCTMEGAVELAQKLRQLGYDRYVAVDNLRKLPERVLKLLGE